MAHVVPCVTAACQRRRRRWLAYFTVHLGRDLFGLHKIHRQMQEFKSSQRHAGRINKHRRAETSGTSRPWHHAVLMICPNPLIASLKNIQFRPIVVETN